ncbi:serine hydrolase domain-containing protein [Lacrimispora defluvii]|uniref:Beta-lactamase family protein n=1 Tax=Lacrimispora defluvii TaxID=2719233 RepID=A0ABX1W1B1_9FIRM|nr:serine hydrolase domain-containing protein [Lacrimispora defluvii]NNJ32852.1 beta-lactamase family protein [Lacrimispora defluvii]
MKRTIHILILAAFTVGFFAVSALALVLPDRKIRPNSPAEEYTAFLDARIPKLMQRYGIPGVNIALVQNEQIVYTMAYGDADREAGRKMTIDMPMRVQSISKSVTALAVLKLAEEGRLNLDDPVEKYIKDWKLPASVYSPDDVTVRRLLCHTAGLPLGDVFALYAPDEPAPSLKESLTRSATLFQAPGKGFSYSNVGYNLLELLIEEVTGRDFAEYMKNEILSPLGMNHSSFEWSTEALAAVPLGYTLDGKLVLPYRYAERASGGLLATAEDIARLCISGMPAFSKQQILTSAGIEQLYAPQAERLGIYGMVFDAYGFGHYIERFSSGELAVSHGGQGTGWMSHFHAVPETGDAIVILTNSQRSWPFIAGVLNGWARWCGFSAPGMASILWGECSLWALVGLVCATALIQVIRMGIRLASGSLNLTPLRPVRTDMPRIAQLGITIFMLVGLLWCVNQKYLFISSIFPAASVWLGISVCAYAIVLLLSALFPRVDEIDAG